MLPQPDRPNCSRDCGGSDGGGFYGNHNIGHRRTSVALVAAVVFVVDMVTVGMKVID